MIDKQKITQPLSYFGGKKYLAKHIHELLPKNCSTRVIGCAGGMAEFWNMPCNNVSEIVNDLNKEIINFYTVLKNHDTYYEFVRQVNFTPFSNVIFNEAKQQIISDPVVKIPSVERAVYFYVYLRQSFSSTGSSFKLPSRTQLRNGMEISVSAWLNSIDGLDLVHKRLRRVMILNVDVIKLINMVDHHKTWIYIDPPYVSSTREKNSRKVYGEFEWNDAKHIELLNLVTSAKSMIAISGYESEMYNKALSHWNKKIIVTRTCVDVRQRNFRTEIIWYNY